MSNADNELPWARFAAQNGVDELLSIDALARAAVTGTSRCPVCTGNCNLGLQGGHHVGSGLSSDSRTVSANSPALGSTDVVVSSFRQIDDNSENEQDDDEQGDEDEQDEDEQDEEVEADRAFQHSAEEQHGNDDAHNGETEAGQPTEESAEVEANVEQQPDNACEREHDSEKGDPHDSSNEQDSGDESLDDDVAVATECTICDDSKQELDFPVILTETCQHEQLVCSTCVEVWISTQLENGSSDIPCPSCDELLEHNDIQRLAITELYQRYLTLTLLKALSSTQTFLYCFNSSCQSGQYHEGDLVAEPIFTCQTCKSKFCLGHDPPAWHEGEPCKQYENRMQQRKRKREADELRKEEIKRANVESEQYVQSIAKVCPGCGACIQKYEGCDHMTCTNCRHEFCYSCLEDYSRIRDEGNRHHERSCPHHEANLPEIGDYDQIEDEGDEADEPSDEEIQDTTADEMENLPIE